MEPLNGKVATAMVVVIAAMILVLDVNQPRGVAGGIPYIALPLIGLLTRSMPLVIVAALLGTVLTGVGFVLSEPGSDPHFVLINRAKCVALIWTATAISLHHLRIGNRLRQQLREQASTDPLTGLYNRRYVFARIRDELTRYERYRTRFSIILMDADHFKTVNDKHGHVAGDATLCRIANKTLAMVRDADVVGRFGGEEFIVLLPHTTAQKASVVAERIRQSMHDMTADSADGAVAVTVSLGVAEAGATASTFDTLLAAADDALYDAKRAGRDRVATRTSPAPEPAITDAA